MWYWNGFTEHSLVFILLELFMFRGEQFDPMFVLFQDFPRQIFTFLGKFDVMHWGNDTIEVLFMFCNHFLYILFYIREVLTYNIQFSA